MKKSEIIIETAQRLFLERGYDATSLDEIASEAGVSKTTVYSNFNDKETLFATVVEGVTANAARILTSLEESLNTDTDIELRLKTLAMRFLAGVLRPEVIQLRRLAISEALRFPKVAAGYWNNGPAQSITLLGNAFRELNDKGELRIEQPDVAATQFAYLVIGRYQDRALLNPREMPSDAEKEDHVTAAVATFLSAHG